MASGFFTDIASTVLSKTLDAAAARQKSIAGNIANVETPGYRRNYVSFEEQLQSVLSRDKRHDVRKGLQELAPQTLMDTFSPSKPDGNNVNIDAEVADLARTALKHRAAGVLLEGKIAMLRAAISEGRR